MEGEDGQELRKKLHIRFIDTPEDLVSAALSVYFEIVKWHERNVRLAAAEFAAAKKNPEFLRKMVIFLLASDLARDIKVPLITKFWLVEEMGGKRGWVKMKLRLPKKSAVPKS